MKKIICAGFCTHGWVMTISLERSLPGASMRHSSFGRAVRPPIAWGPR